MATACTCNTSPILAKQIFLCAVGLAWVFTVSSKCCSILVSHSQTAFSSFIFGRKGKGSGKRPIIIFVLKIPAFWDFMRGFRLMLKDRKGSLIGESNVITLYCQPDQRLRELFVSQCPLTLIRSHA